MWCGRRSLADLSQRGDAVARQRTTRSRRIFQAKRRQSLCDVTRLAQRRPQPIPLLLDGRALPCVAAVAIGTEGRCNAVTPVAPLEHRVVKAPDQPDALDLDLLRDF